MKTAYDVAIYIPMAEMARTRLKYLPVATYYYETGTGLNTYAIYGGDQVSNEKLIRSRSKY